jgi:hypothetical protein
MSQQQTREHPTEGDRLDPSIATITERAVKNGYANYTIATHCPDGHKHGLHLIYDQDATTHEQSFVAIVDIGSDALSVRRTGKGIEFEATVETQPDDLSGAKLWLIDGVFNEFECVATEYYLDDYDDDNVMTITMRDVGEEATVRARLLD